MSEAIYAAKMTLETSGFSAAMAKVRESTSRALDIVKGMAPILTGLGGAFAAFRGGEAMAEGLHQAIEAGRQFQIQARQQAQSVGTMVLLNRAFIDATGSAEGVTTALFMMQKALGGVNDEGQPTSTAFRRMGLSLSDMKKMNAVQQLQALSDGMGKLKDGTEKAAVAEQIFGRSGIEVMAILNDQKGFKASIAANREYAKTMQANAGAFEQVSKAAEEVGMKIQELYAGVAAGLAPALEAVLGYINKIDFAKWGREIGQAVAIITEAFKDGKVTEILRLGLVVAFKDAGNVLIGTAYAYAAAMMALFKNIPKLIADAFSMLTNPTFWKGIGQLLLGAFLSIGGELTKFFYGLADSLGNGIADVLDKVPGMKNLVEGLRSSMNRGNERVQEAAGALTRQGNSMTESGASEVASASAPLVGDYMNTILSEATAAFASFEKNSKTFDSSPEAKKLAALISSLAAKVAPSGGETLAGPSPKTPGGAAALSIKPEDHADRLAKLGLFIGSAPQTPGLSEARRTAAATEAMKKGIDKLTQHFSNKPIGVQAVYA